MKKAKTSDKIGNHPEAENIKNICEVLPKSRETKEVCQPLNQYNKEKNNQTK